MLKPGTRIPGMGTVGHSLDGFRLEPWWSEEGELTTVSYLLTEANAKLTATIDDVEEDSISTEKLLRFFAEKGVISPSDEWYVDAVSGCVNTMIDATWTTVIFRRKIAP